MDPRETPIAVDAPYASHANEIARVLVAARLHPEYDKRPLKAVRGRSFAKTTIYVPESEAARARDVLGAYYAGRSERIAAITTGLWQGLIVPLSIAAACGGVAALAAGQPGPGVVVAFLTFIPLTGWWHRPRRA